MAEGQLVRVQKDLLEEINNCKGASFSERARHWKLKEVEQTLETVENLTGSDKALTVNDLREMLEERFQQMESDSSDEVNDMLTVDDIDDVVREAVRDEVEELLRLQ